MRIHILSALAVTFGLLNVPESVAAEVVIQCPRSFEGLMKANQPEGIGPWRFNSPEANATFTNINVNVNAAESRIMCIYGYPEVRISMFNLHQVIPNVNNCRVENRDQGIVKCQRNAPVLTSEPPSTLENVPPAASSGSGKKKGKKW